MCSALPCQAFLQSLKPGNFSGHSREKSRFLPHRYIFKGPHQPCHRNIGKNNYIHHRREKHEQKHPMLTYHFLNGIFVFIFVCLFILISIAFFPFCEQIDSSFKSNRERQRNRCLSPFKLKDQSSFQQITAPPPMHYTVLQTHPYINLKARRLQFGHHFIQCSVNIFLSGQAAETAHNHSRIFLIAAVYSLISESSKANVTGWGCFPSFFNRSFYCHLSGIHRCICKLIILNCPGCRCFPR